MSQLSIDINFLNKDHEEDVINKHIVYDYDWDNWTDKNYLPKKVLKTYLCSKIEYVYDYELKVSKVRPVIFKRKINKKEKNTEEIKSQIDILKKSYSIEISPASDNKNIVIDIFNEKELNYIYNYFISQGFSCEVIK